MNFYINRSAEILDRTKKLVEFQDFENAKKMANDSMIYSDMAYYSSLVYNADEFKAVWVFPYQKNMEEVEQAFNRIKKLGVENIILEVYYNGLTVYPSEIAKKYNLPVQNQYYKGFDALEAWVKLAKENNKNLIASFNVLDMGNPPKSRIKKHLVSIYPEWLNKTAEKKSSKSDLCLDAANIEVQGYTLALIQEVAENYEIAGINIKGLNYPNEKWGYTNVAMSEFKKLYDVNPKKIKRTDEKYQLWQDFKETKISEFANKISKLAQEKETQVYYNIYADENISQNIKQWDLNENTVVLPVLNSADDDFAKDFLAVVKENSKTDKIYPIYLEAYQEQKPRRFFDQLTIARGMGLNGLVLYDLDSLNREYYDALKLSVFNIPEKEKEQKSLIENEKEEEKDGVTIKN